MASPNPATTINPRINRSNVISFSNIMKQELDLMF